MMGSCCPYVWGSRTNFFQVYTKKYVHINSTDIFKPEELLSEEKAFESKNIFFLFACVK